jgi:AraC-like DNA-binding protein
VRDAPKPDAMEDYFVKKVRKIAESHLDDFHFSVEELCQEIHLRHSQLHRKLVALTGFSATMFIRHIRLEKAREPLRNPELTITTIAYDTGFNDVGYFGKVFRQAFGVTPSEWREKHKINPTPP